MDNGDTMNGHVRIGPEFFRKSREDYADWAWAIAREFMQNSIDAGARAISVDVAGEDGNTRLIVRNDGRPMSREELLDKLLTLGASGKNFLGGAVGGFGKAKEILYFTHLRYRIATGGLEVTGSGAEFEMSPRSPDLRGTESDVLVEGDMADKLLLSFGRFARFAQWGGELRINGDPTPCRMHKGSPRRDMGWCRVHTNRSESGALVVRTHGIPMFIQYVSCDRCVVVELAGSPGEFLAANRDGLKYDYQAQLQAFVARLLVDRRAALRSATRLEYMLWDGRPLEAGGADSETDAEPASDAAMAGAAAQAAACTTRDAAAVTICPTPPWEDDATTDARVAEPHGEGASRFWRPSNDPPASVGCRFVIKNTIAAAKVPRRFKPGHMSRYAERLLALWRGSVVEVAGLLGLRGAFAVGFVFDEELVALLEKSDRFGTVFYINPCVLGRSALGRTVLRRRWRLSDPKAVLAAAVHEVVHGLGYSFHDEEYAGALTQAFAKVLRARSRRGRKARAA